MQYRIDLHHPIFTTNPAIRFAETMKVPVDFSEDMWRRYHTLAYSEKDLQDWFQLKTKREISIKTIQRWVVRQEIYHDAQRALKEGAQQVTAEYFKNNLNMVRELIFKDKIV